MNLQWIAERRDLRRNPAPGRFVRLSDTEVHVVVEGSGPPVLIDSGLGGSSIEWARVAAQLTPEFTVIRYDRPGFAWSPASTGDRRSVAAGTRIVELLSALNVKGPVILVGHSLGGVHVRAAAALAPDLVGGLVLVDPSHEGMLDEAADLKMARMFGRALRVMSWLAPYGVARLIGRPLAKLAVSDARQPLHDEARAGAKCAELLTLRTVHGLRALAAEHGCLEESLRQFVEFTETTAEPDVPVTVITGAAPSPNPRIAAARGKIDPLHAELVAKSPRGRHVFAANSGHLVPLDQPEIIVQCVRETSSAMQSNA